MKPAKSNLFASSDFLTVSLSQPPTQYSEGKELYINIPTLTGGAAPCAGAAYVYRPYVPCNTGTPEPTGIRRIVPTNF